MNLPIHPSIGVARLGNNTTEICLSPDTIDGLPFDSDNNGNSLGSITSFKDAVGLIKRQGQPFKILSDTGEQITLNTPNVASIEWTMHLANKKTAFDQNNFIQGHSSMAAWGSERIMVRDSIFNTETESFQLNCEKFDDLLLKNVSEKGGMIFPRTKYQSFDQDKNHHWMVDVKHETNETKGNCTIKADYLIDATGRMGSVCRKIGVRSKRYDELVAIGRFFYFDEYQTIEQNIIIESVEEGWWYCASLPNHKMTLTFFSDAQIIKEKKLENTENWSRLLLKTKHISSLSHDENIFLSERKTLERLCVLEKKDLRGWDMKLN